MNALVQYAYMLYGADNTGGFLERISWNGRFTQSADRWNLYFGRDEINPFDLSDSDTAFKQLVYYIVNKDSMSLKASSKLKAQS